MPSAYLATGDFAAYGLSRTTTADQIRAASLAVDHVLGRPEGIVWQADAAGIPCCMAGLDPTFTFALAAPLSPGLAVTATITPAYAGQDLVGDVLVLDRGADGAREACVVAAVIDPGTIILARVRYAHAQGATADQGLLLIEERALPAKRAVARLSRVPCAALASVQGRYGYGRRSTQVEGFSTDANLIASVGQFGAPQWLPVDASACSVSQTTGEVYVPAGFLLAVYTDVRIRYVAGWPATAIPAQVKAATAMVVSTLAATVDMPGQIKMYRAGDHQIQRFAASAIDPDTRARLAPFVARVMY